MTSPITRLRAPARSQSGAVLVMVAIALPVLIGMSGLVIDVGNWFAHKRHLQTQADAGALAGAGKFRYPCSNAPILSEVSKYSSVDTGGDDGYNPQIGGTLPDELHQEINSPTWYDQATPVDDSVRTGGPCEAKMIDVKLTETNLPWWLRAAQLVPYINTHARVEVRTLTTAEGALPVGVPEVGPKLARALFVNEATGTVLASANLTAAGTSGGLAIWRNATAVALNVNTTDIGVRIVLSGSTSTNCGDPLVTCYGAGTSASIVPGAPGLSHVRGYDTSAGTAAAPRAKDVQLFGATCEDGYFTATATYPCTLNVSATVDFGGASISTVRILAKKTGAGNNTAVELTPPASSGGAWTGSTGFSAAAGTGAMSVDLLWQTDCPTDRTKNCNKGTPLASIPGGSAAQRVYSASESLSASGPIKLLRVSEGGVPGANSFALGTSHALVVTIGFKPTLQNAAAVGDPKVVLKVAGGGSHNQALDCDPTGSPPPNLEDELQTGCTFAYTENEGVTCPSSSGALDTVFGDNPPNKWPCVGTNQGATVGQVTHGLNMRMFGDKNAGAGLCSKAPNNWANFPNFDPGDPRIVQVFVTPFGAFDGSGDTTVPVIKFSTFYVTGWDGGACQGLGDDTAGQGEVVGHFIKYIQTLNSGGAGEETCDFTAFGSCVAVMTR